MTFYFHIPNIDILTIISADILLSTTTLQKPAFPTFDIHGMQRSYAPHKTYGKYPTFQNSEVQGSAFFIFLDWGLKIHHVRPFLHLADFTTTLAAYYYGILQNPNIPEIASDRNVVQHQLLSLPTMSELLQKMRLEEENLKLYEAGRLTALLYAVMVTFPIPRSNNIRDILLHDLKDMILSINLSGKSKGIIEFCLWCSVVGGIAALGKPELPCYFEQTKRIVTMLGLREWNEVEDKLAAFAWLKIACSQGGIKFWALVKDDEAV